jgi:hypothetical protein
MSKESNEELKTRLEPSCSWKKTDPRDAGGNRNIIIFGGYWVALARVEIEEGSVIELCDTGDVILGVIAGGQERKWPSHFRWIELPPKEDEE